MPAQPVTIFARGTRTASEESVKFGNAGFRGIMLFLNVYQASGTGGLVPQLRRYDPIDATQKILWSIPIAVTATGTYDYIHYPGANEAQTAIYYAVSLPLPEQWTIVMTQRDASIYEWSMSGSYVP